MPEGRSVPAACSDTSAHAQVMLRVVIWAAVWSSAAACGNLNITKPTAYLNAMADNLPKDYCIKSAGHVSPAHGALDARCVLEAWFSSALDTLQELMGNLEMSGRLYRDVKGLYDFTNQFLRQCNYSCPNGVPLEVITPKHFCSLTLKAFQAALHLSGRPGSVSTRELAPWLPVTPAARHGEACACSQAQLLDCCAADSPQPPTVTARSTAGAPGEATGPVTSDQTDARVAGKVWETGWLSERAWGPLAALLVVLCVALAVALPRKLRCPRDPPRPLAAGPSPSLTHRDPQSVPLLPVGAPDPREARAEAEQISVSAAAGNPNNGQPSSRDNT